MDVLCFRLLLRERRGLHGAVTVKIQLSCQNLKLGDMRELRELSAGISASPSLPTVISDALGYS